MAICSEIRLKLLQKLLQMYKYTMFVNKHVLQKLLHEVVHFCCRNEKMIKNYLLQIVAAYNKWKMQQLATVSATSVTYLQQFLQQFLQQMQQLATVSATRQTQ